MKKTQKQFEEHSGQIWHAWGDGDLEDGEAIKRLIAIAAKHIPHQQVTAAKMLLRDDISLEEYLER